MITVYYLENSRASRITWVLEELNVPYELKVYYRNPKTQLAPKELQQIHPAGTSPIIKDGDFVLAESGLIIEYLIDKYGKDSELTPKSTKETWHVRYGITECESNLMIAAMQLYINGIAKTRLPYGLGFIGGKIIDGINQGYSYPSLVKLLNVLDTTFANNNGYYSEGHLTGADIMYYTSITLVRREKMVQGFDTKFPNITKWLQTISVRPAFKKMESIEADVQAKKKASLAAQ